MGDFVGGELLVIVWIAGAIVAFVVWVGIKVYANWMKERYGKNYDLSFFVDMAYYTYSYGSVECFGFCFFWPAVLVVGSLYWVASLLYRGFRGAIEGVLTLLHGKAPVEEDYSEHLVEED